MVKTGRPASGSNTRSNRDGKVARGAIAIGVVNLVKTGLQLLLLPVMARLLGPAEFGLYALALSSVSFLLMFADGGLGNSLAREPDENTAIWSTAFWALMISSLVLCLLSIGLSVPIAYWAHQPRLPPLVAGLSVSIVLASWAVSPQARLMRDGRLGVTAVADLASFGVGALTAVVLALNGGGAWSLAAQFLMVFAIRVAILNGASARAPGLVWDWRQLRPHLVVGGSIVGVKLSDYLSRLLENALIGRYLGATALGAYSLGNQVPKFLTEAVQNPLWANLYVKCLRGSPQEVATAFYQCVRVYALVLLPGSLLLAAGIEPLVVLLMGPEWRATGALMRWLLPAMAVGSLGVLSSAALYAKGRSDVQLGLAGAYALARIAVVAAAPLIGLAGVAVGVSAAACVYGVAGVVVPAKIVGFKSSAVGKALFWPLSISAAVSVGCYAAVQRAPSSLIGIMGCEVVAALVFVALVTAADRRAVMRDISGLRSLLGLNRRRLGPAALNTEA